MDWRTEWYEFEDVAYLNLAAQAAPPRRLKIGHTGITWGYSPANAEQAIKDIASQGFYGFESFGNVIEAWEPKGGIGKVLDEARLPLISAYCGVNLTEAAQRSAATRCGRALSAASGGRARASSRSTSSRRADRKASARATPQATS